MFYLGFGADFVRDDMFYLFNLLSSINADLDALVSSGQGSFTEGRAKLLLDKLALRSDALEKYNALGAAGDPAFASVAATMQTTAADITTLNGKIESKLAVVTKWNPVPGQEMATPPVYKQGVAFTSPPTIYAKNALAPSPETMDKLTTQISTWVKVKDMATYKQLYKEGGEAALRASLEQAKPRAPVSAGGVPAVALVGLAAVAAWFLMNR